MKYRLDIHFGERTDTEIKDISMRVSKKLGMEVYLVRDYTTARLGMKVKPDRTRVEGDWRSW